MWLLLFIGIPAVELYLLIDVGGRIGLFYTLAIIIFTGVLGWSLVKHQGLSTRMRIQQQMSQGMLPAREMVSGLVLLAAGIVLLTPGFLTDAVGFTLLVPPIRDRVAGWLLQRFKARINISPGGRGFGGPDGPTPPAGGRVIWPKDQ